MSKVMRRIVTRSGKEPPLLRASDLASVDGHDANAPGLAEILGVRAVFEVEENEFMRDKIALWTTFGMAGKKGISETFNLGENPVGSVWKKSILLVKASSFALYPTKASASSLKSPSSSRPTSPASARSATPPVPGDDHSIASGTSHENSTTSSPRNAASIQGYEGSDPLALLQRAEDPPRMIVSMEDIAYVSEIKNPKNPEEHNLILIRTVNFKTLVLKLKDKGQVEVVLDAMEAALKAYKSAMDALSEGLIDDKSDNYVRSFKVLQVTQEIDGKETVVCSFTKNGAPFSIKRLSSQSPCYIYVSGPFHRVFKAKVVPYQVRLAAKASGAKDAPAPSWKAMSVDSGTEEKASVPLSAARYAASNFLSLHVKVSIAETQPVFRVGPRPGPFEPGLTLHVRETRMVFVVTILVLAAFIAPEWAYQRKSVLLLLVLPVMYVMLSVRNSAGHIATLAANTLKGQGNDADDAVSCTIAVLDAQPGLLPKVMDPYETQEQYEAAHTEKGRAELLAALGDMGMSVREVAPKGASPVISTGGSVPPENQKEPEGIDAVIATLSGSDRIEQLTDADCPKKWYDAADGNAKSAIKQWRDSLAWRRDNDVDNVLSKPQNKFFLIKSMFPHYWLGHDEDGNLVTLERFEHARANIQKMKQAGITAEEFRDHCVFLNEFWIKNKLTKTGRLHKIVDIKGVGLSDIPDLKAWFTPMNAALQTYPELVISIKIINVPSSFSFLYRVVSPFIPQKTSEKIAVVSGGDKYVAKELGKKIAPKILPPSYGGTYTGLLRDLPLEVESADYTRRLNANNNVPNTGDWDPQAIHIPTAAPASPLGTPARTPLSRAVSIRRPQSTPIMSGASFTDVELDMLEQLIGNWQMDKEKSDSMEPLHIAQGLSYLSRKASASFTFTQNVQLTGSGSGSETRSITIATKVGPVVRRVEGPINKGSAGVLATSTEGETTIIRLKSPAPQELAELCDAAVEVESVLPNKDVRRVYHAISRDDPQKKLQVILFHRFKDNVQIAPIKQIFQRVTSLS